MIWITKMRQKQEECPKPDSPSHYLMQAVEVIQYPIHQKTTLDRAKAKMLMGIFEKVIICRK